MIFYKVLALQIDVFESQIVDERHFQTIDEAKVFARDVDGQGLVALVLKM